MFGIEDLNKDKFILETEQAVGDVQNTDYTRLQQDNELALSIERLALLKQNREERKNFATKIFLFTCGWTLVIAVILIMSGLKCWSFNLSDTVLVTLITTTTANSFGFFLLVVRYIFNVNENI